jgi:hypothetical protein
VSKTDSPYGERNVHRGCTLKQGTLALKQGWCKRVSRNMIPCKIKLKIERTDKNEQLQIKFKQKNDIKNEAKENRYMGRKTQKPVINSVTVSYSGDQEKFDNFIGSLLKSYLDSDSLTNTEQLLSVQKVDLSEKSA